MKCPKCSLVTFDHLPKCPRCRTSFELKRRLTRPRRDPSRAILIPADPNERPEPNAKDAARRARPIAPPAPLPEQRPAAPSPAPRLIAAPEHEAPEQESSGDEARQQRAPSDEQQVADRRRLKERMVRASQARRRSRPDLVTQVADPSLPDWYEPAMAEDLEPRAALATSTKNRTR